MSDADRSAAETTAALSPYEARALIAIAASSGPVTADDIAASSELAVDQARSSAEFLRMKGAVDAPEDQEVELKSVAITDVGAAYRKLGHPRQRLLDVVRGASGITPADLRSKVDVEPAESGAALGWLKQNGLVRVGKDGLVQATAEPFEGKAATASAHLATTAALLARLEDAGDEAQPWESISPEEAKVIDEETRKRGKARGPFKVDTTTIRYYVMTDAGRGLVDAAKGVIAAAENEIGQLTSDHLRDGSWKGKSFRRYSMNIRPPRAVAGRRHPYREFLDRVKRSLIGLGFEQMTGGLVESEFWNMDALFMPQFHPARAIHDAYYVAKPTHAREIEQPYLDNVAAAHENGGDTGSIGWSYDFDRERTRRLLLRSQGTALSARMLSKVPRVPGKYFGMARCFRCDTVDATHAPDFFQVEGIVLGEEISLRHLLGLLKIFALEIAQSEVVKFAPTYFPFTEPSVEIHMKHPRLGWVELGGSGVFRPELTKPLGIDVPVIAWGLGLDRMAMVALGINDIRELFSGDLELIRGKKLRP